MPLENSGLRVFLTKTTQTDVDEEILNEIPKTYSIDEVPVIDAVVETETKTLHYDLKWRILQDFPSNSAAVFQIKTLSPTVCSPTQRGELRMSSNTVDRARAQEATTTYSANQLTRSQLHVSVKDNKRLTKNNGIFGFVHLVVDIFNEREAAVETEDETHTKTIIFQFTFKLVLKESTTVPRPIVPSLSTSRSRQIRPRKPIEKQLSSTSTRSGKPSSSRGVRSTSGSTSQATEEIDLHEARRAFQEAKEAHREAKLEQLEALQTEQRMIEEETKRLQEGTDKIKDGSIRFKRRRGF